MIEIAQNELVDVIVARLKELAVGEVKKGTYNRQDPTYFEKFRAIVGMWNGFRMVKEEDTGEEYPQPENVRVTVDDVTWGVELELITSVAVEKGYWSRPAGNLQGEWCRCTPRFFEVMKRLWIEGGIKDCWKEGENETGCEMLSAEACV